VSTPYQLAVLADGAVSFVPGNELSGLLHDIVQMVADASTVHPTVGNAAPGGLGGAAAGFYTTPSPCSIVFPNPFSASPTLAITTEMWFNSVDSIGGGGGLAAQAALLFADIPGAGLSDWALGVFGAMKPSWGMGHPGDGDDELDAPNGLNDGRWHHIVVTWDGSVGIVNMYVDAVNVASSGGFRTLSVAGFSQWYCGLHFTGWNGLGCNWALYGTALTPTQILNHYNLSNMVGVVPVVVGQTLAPGTATLVSAGYQYTSLQASSSVAAGVIVSQNPVGGTTFALGGNVTIVVSTGPAQVAGVLGDKWGSAGGGIESNGTPEILGHLLANASQPINALNVPPNQSVSAALSLGQTITQATPASSVPTTPKLGPAGGAVGAE
jgi:Concanavalin A-like lectin/glucanases superfamily/PASTA domain